MKKNSPIFICGEGRSGTKLLRDCLAKHSELHSFRSESYFFVDSTFQRMRFIDEIKDTKTLTKAVLTTLLSKNKANAEKLIKSRNFENNYEDYYKEINPPDGATKFELLDLCADYLTKEQGKKRWIEKTPYHIYFIDRIKEFYPEAKFIINYRDPRAVVASWLKKDSDKTLIGVCQAWNKVADEITKLKKNKTKNIYLMKYEELIQEPEKVIKEICDFLEEDYDAKLLDVSVVNSFYNEQGQSGFNTNAVKRWQKTLNQNQISLINFLTRTNRKQLNYNDFSQEAKSTNLLASFLKETMLLIIKKTSKFLKWIRPLANALLIFFCICHPCQAAINKIDRGPYLQLPKLDQMTVRWRTKKPSISLLELYHNDSKHLYQDLVKKTEHELKIEELKPDTKYSYAILAEKKEKRRIIKNKNDSSLFSFKTFPEKKDIKSQVLILGDPGILADKSISSKFREKQLEVIKGINYYKEINKLNDFDFILTLGDNAYHSGSDKEFQKGFFEPYADLLAHTPLLTCFGNHDSGLNREFLSYTARSYPKPRGVYYDIFSLPDNEAYYSFDHGGAHFIVLDSFDSIWEDLKADYSNYEKIWERERAGNIKNSMLEWLKNDLENNLSTWNIVVFHHPPFTEESDYEKQDIWRAWVNSYIVPLIEKHKVDLVLSGHIHNYQRTFPVLSRESETRNNHSKVKSIKSSKEKFFRKYLEKKQLLHLRKLQTRTSLQ